MDIREACIDEISLEGLEGITLPTLWLRLENRQPPIRLSDKIKDYLWGFIVQHDGFRFYQLPGDRDEPQIFDRFGGNDTGWIPTAKAPDEIDTLRLVYSSNPMSDGVTGIRGSCSDYEQRTDVSDDISSTAVSLGDAVSKYGAKKFAIVASQCLRERSLLKTGTNPRVIDELGDVAYAILERLGRSRWQGDLQVVLDKKVFTDKTYHIHYVMTKLYKLGLVVKHQYTYRREDKSNRAFFQVLIHLARFGRDCRSSLTRNIDALRATLEMRPNMTMNLGALREHSKTDDRHFKTLYHAMQKSGMAVVENIDPTKKPKSIKQKTITLLKKFDGGDDEEEDDDMMGMFTSGSEADVSALVLEKPLLYQSYDFLVQQGESGATQNQMQQFLKGYGRLEARNVCRNLERMELTTSILVDRGRQRSQTFIAKNLAQMNSSTREFTDEKNKMRQLLCESSMLGGDQSGMSTTNVTESETQNTQTVDDLILETAQSVSQESCDAEEETNLNESSNDCAHTSVAVVPFNPLSCSSPRLNLADTTHVNSHKKWDANLTTRKIKRHNIILEALNREKVIEGLSTLQKILMKKEEDDGMMSRIDRKTVRRLITKMHDDGFLHHHVVPIEHEDVVRELELIVSLDCGAKRLKAAVDMAKFKMASEEETKAVQKNKSKKSGGKRRADKSDDEDVIDCSRLKRVDTNSAVLERYQPKFKRLRIVHQMLYYLTYEHPLLAELIGNDVESDAVAANTINLDKVHVYQDEFTWRRFLPCIPIHFRGGNRWLQLGDVAVVLPIAIACQFHRISYEVEGLESWLVHPERRFCLIRHLPPAMRALLQYKRRLLYSLMTCIEQLAFMGLMTIQKLGSSNPNTMPKENMMLYVHRKATILDTRASANAHFKVEDKPYESIDFEFDNSSDVDSFWYKLQDICLKTPIGCLHLQEPDYIDIKDHIGLVTLKAFRNQMLERVGDPIDDGRIPGDQRGAGGLDSSMYSYLFRNWSSASRYKYTPKQPRKRRGKKGAEEERATIEHIPFPALEYSTEVSTVASPENKLDDREQNDETTTRSKGALSEPKVVEVSNVGRNEKVKGGKGVKRKEQTTPMQEEPVKKKQRAFFRKRRLKSKKITVKRQRLKYTDEKDLAAIMSRKGKCRVSFTHAEDSLMLICHVANTIMIRNFWRHAHDPRRSLVSWLTIRDIMQSILPETHDKTSISLGRRTRFLMKNQDMRICHDICVTDATSDRKMIVETLPTLDEFGELSSDQVIAVYRKLVEKLRARFQSPPGIFLGEIPDNDVEISDTFTAKIVPLKKERKGPRRQHFRDELHTTRDITGHSLENVIYVALTMGDDEFNIYQAFRAFEHFPNDIFTEVFSSVKRSGWVSSKLETRRRTSFGVPSHKLSYSHRLSFNTPVPQHSLTEFWESVSPASEAEIKLGIDATFGDVFLACRYFWDATAESQIDIPNQIILPDTRTNSAFENQFLKTMKEVEEEIEGGKLPLPDGSRPSNLVTAAKCLLDQSADAVNTSDEDDKEESDSKNNNNKLLNLMRMYRRHPSYTNWLLLMEPGKPTCGTGAKFGIHTNYALNSDNVALTPCEIRIRNINILPTDAWMENEDSILRLFESKKFKRNESALSWERLLSGSTQEQRKLLEGILETIGSKGEFGIRISDLYVTMHTKLPTADDCINKCIQLLTDNAVIFTVGVTEKRYVTYKNVLPWLATGYCFTGARSKFRDEVSHELNRMEHRQRQMLLSENADPSIVIGDDDKGNEAVNGTREEENAMDVDDAKSPARDADLLTQNGPDKKQVQLSSSIAESSDVNEPVTNGTAVDKRAVVLGFGSFNERVQYLCRPWHSISGGVNPKTVKLVFSSVFLRIVSEPGITVNKLLSCYDFQPVCILEVVDILCEADCLTEHTVQVPGPTRLFGRRKGTSTVKYLNPTIDGPTKVALMCNILEEHAKQQESNS